MRTTPTCSRRTTGNEPPGVTAVAIHRSRHRVTGALGSDYEMLDPDDPQALAAVARLRADCTQAKEGLSLNSEARVPVLLPTVQTEVRVTRAELEAMIRPTLAETVTALERALRSASLTPAMVHHVLLVGGSSRIPLVSDLLSSGLGRPVAVDAHPKHAVALGAAIVAARASGALLPTPGPPGPPSPVGRPPSAPPPPGRPSPAGLPPSAPPPPAPPGGRPPAPGTRRAIGGLPRWRDAPGAGDIRRPASRLPHGRGQGVPAALRPPQATPDGRAGAADRARRRARDDRHHDREQHGGDLADIEPGDCFTGEANDLDAVDCAQPHDAELYAVVPGPDPGAAYPRADTAQTDGEASCTMALVDYYGATVEVAIANGLDAAAIAPTEDQWNDGETDTYCVAVPADGGQTEGSIQGIGAG